MSAFAELGVSPVTAEAKPRPRFEGQYLWLLVAILALAALVRVGIVGRRAGGRLYRIPGGGLTEVIHLEGCAI